MNRRSVADQHVADLEHLPVIRVAQRIDDDLFLISRAELGIELVQQPALLEGSEDLGHGLVHAIQALLRRKRRAELAELLACCGRRAASRRAASPRRRHLEILPDLRIELVQRRRGGQLDQRVPQLGPQLHQRLGILDVDVTGLVAGPLLGGLGGHRVGLREGRPGNDVA